MTRDLKYLIAYFAPLFVFGGLYLGGWLSLGVGYLAFVIIPILDKILPQVEDEYDQNEILTRTKKKYFDYLLYLHLPIIYFLLAYYLTLISYGERSFIEKALMALNVGILLGGFGINIAHELGHRKNSIDKLISLLLLMPSFYMHFQIAHNLGHHKNVGTDKDSASAFKNQSVYSFWVQSVIGSYKEAWQIQNQLLKNEGKSWASLNNRMLFYFIFQAGFLAIIWMIFGIEAVFFSVASGIVGFLLLESVNYIEHYGLRRKNLSSGRPEKVNLSHSWNSNHELGRIFLFELTRHPDHHYKSTKKYQTLNSTSESPQLPNGYPASILLSLIPPFWFKTMNPLIPD